MSESESEKSSGVFLTEEQYKMLNYWASIGQQRQPPLLEELFKNPESLKNLNELLKENFSPLVKDYFENVKSTHSGELKYSWRRVGITLFIIGLLAVAITALAIYDKIDSSGVVFFFGTVTGYLLTFLTKIEIGDSQ